MHLAPFLFRGGGGGKNWIRDGRDGRAWFGWHFPHHDTTFVSLGGRRSGRERCSFSFFFFLHLSLPYGLEEGGHFLIPISLISEPYMGCRLSNNLAEVYIQDGPCGKEKPYHKLSLMIKMKTK